VMVKAMTAAVTFHPHLHHIPKKKNSDQIGWQFDWSSRGWLNWTQMRNIKEYLVRERDIEKKGMRVRFAWRRRVWLRCAVDFSFSL
jgi:diadenosine tetraphosphate (Ap4A) HIT family hydrolase